MAAKKSTKKKAAGAAVADVPDPREPLAISPASMKATAAEVRRVIETLEKPEEPIQGEFIDAALHRVFSDKLPCGVGQEILRRVEMFYVDRNEYRVTEAFEVEEMLADLNLPNAFERCLGAKEVISQVFNDQNKSSLEFMREAAIAERKGFYQRVPAMTPGLVAFLNRVVDLDEVLFSTRSTQRVQQRLGYDPKKSATEDFFAEVRELVAPFGHIPLLIGPHQKPGGKPKLDPVLSPLCALVRLGAKMA